MIGLLFTIGWLWAGSMRHREVKRQRMLHHQLLSKSYSGYTQRLGVEVQVSSYCYCELAGGRSECWPSAAGPLPAGGQQFKIILYGEDSCSCVSLLCLELQMVQL